MKSPWGVQAKLMEISGQIPMGSSSEGVGANGDGPALLYAALTMEELSETLSALTRTLAVVDARADDRFLPDRSIDRSAQQASELLVGASRMMLSYSQSIRHLLKWTAEDGNRFVINPDAPKAALDELADGLTDTAVTLFGLCVATGLPVEKCYTEVQRSNLSKANPATGVIDKDPSGKWIKGSNYTPPDLSRILGGAE